jgi:asparagine synthase (glutamine-hydrolysing)
LIASIAARVCAKRIEDDGASAAWWPSLHSFSVGLKDSPDLKAARQVANHIKSVHHEFNFTIEEGLNAINDVIYHLETYDVTTIRAATPMYLMSRKSQLHAFTHILRGQPNARRLFDAA